MQFVRALWADRQGATSIEYALIAALISISAIYATGMLGNALSSTFIAVANDMSNASDGSL